MAETSHAAEPVGPQDLAPLALLLMLVVACFAGTRDVGFLADDFNPALHHRQLDGPAPRVLLSMLLGMDQPGRFVRPLPFFTLWMESRATGGNPVAMHVSNVLLHLAGAAALYLVARALVGRGEAFAVSLLFALHPRRVETVAWISCRPDLLGALLFLTALGAALVARRRGSRAALGVALGATAAALLCKEAFLLAPVVVAVVALPPGGGFSRRLPILALLPAYLVYRRAVLGTWIGGYGAGRHAPGLGSVAIAAKHLAYALVPPMPPLPLPLAAVAPAVALAVVLAAFVALRRSPVVKLAALLVVTMVAPVLALSVSLESSMNDRLLHASSLGVALLVAGALQRWRRLVPTVVAVALLLGALSWRTVERWRTAGVVTASVVAALVEELSRAPGGDPVLLVAIPDSFHGAYVLRNGVQEAVTLAGGDGRRLVPISLYLVDDARRAPVTAARAAGSVRVRSIDGCALLLRDDWTRAAGVEVRASGRCEDPLGRVEGLEVPIDAGSEAWLVGTTGVDRLEFASPRT